ncbi:sensor histidine kinase [Enterococcus sp. AZ072]|uniref:sensor histidine kinase n=1 Tax=unclassified Enterococcus TaxID=2608891 RepID=UPI003D28106A
MLRNKEFRSFILLFGLLTIVFTIIGWKITEAAGILVLISAIVFGVVFFVFTQKRYESIARISDQIDLVLHNEERLFMEELQEGELSILQSEITKMTQRIREQNDALKREKAHLADSLADVAHQLRTPLTSANLTLSLLENTTDQNERKILIRETEELLLRMDWLLTSLLKISRLDAGVVMFNNETIVLSTLLENALRPLAIPMELRNIRIRIEIPEAVRIIGDSGWLAEALQNILKNCMESLDEGGQIDLVCSDNPLFTELIIHDSGPGFRQADLPHLFERFYRGEKDKATGYGIGLALCKMIVTQQNGTITAKNHPQGGALFTLRFPK